MAAPPNTEFDEAVIGELLTNIEVLFEVALPKRGLDVLEVIEPPNTELAVVVPLPKIDFEVPLVRLRLPPNIDVNEDVVVAVVASPPNSEVVEVDGMPPPKTEFPEVVIEIPLKKELAMLVEETVLDVTVVVMIFVSKEEVVEVVFADAAIELPNKEAVLNVVTEASPNMDGVEFFVEFPPNNDVNVVDVSGFVDLAIIVVLVTELKVASVLFALVGATTSVKLEVVIALVAVVVLTAAEFSEGYLIGVILTAGLEFAVVFIVGIEIVGVRELRVIYELSNIELLLPNIEAIGFSVISSFGLLLDTLLNIAAAVVAVVIVLEVLFVSVVPPKIDGLVMVLVILLDMEIIGILAVEVIKDFVL